MFVLGLLIGLGIGFIFVAGGASSSAKKAEEKALTGCHICGCVYYGDPDLDNWCKKNK